MAEYKLLINGELVNSSAGKTVDDIGPATGEPIARVPQSTLEDVERAVAAAREAFDDGLIRLLETRSRSYISCVGHLRALEPHSLWDHSYEGQ